MLRLGLRAARPVNVTFASSGSVPVALTPTTVLPLPKPAPSGLGRRSAPMGALPGRSHPDARAAVFPLLDGPAGLSCPFGHDLLWVSFPQPRARRLGLGLLAGSFVHNRLPFLLVAQFIAGMVDAGDLVGGHGRDLLGPPLLAAADGAQHALRGHCLLATGEPPPPGVVSCTSEAGALLRGAAGQARCNSRVSRRGRPGDDSCNGAALSRPCPMLSETVAFATRLGRAPCDLRR